MKEKKLVEVNSNISNKNISNSLSEKNNNVLYKKLDNLYLSKKSFSFKTKPQHKSFNIVSENGDGTYSLPTEKVISEGEHIFISLSEIRKIVNQIVDQRLEHSSLIKNNNKNEQE